MSSMVYNCVRSVTSPAQAVRVSNNNKFLQKSHIVTYLRRGVRVLWGAIVAAGVGSAQRGVGSAGGDPSVHPPIHSVLIYMAYLRDGYVYSIYLQVGTVV